MLVEVIHPETGEKHYIDIPSLRSSDVDKMAREYAKDEQIRSHIEKLPVSAEIKAILFKLTKFTINVGHTLIKVGKRVLEMVFMLAQKYQETTFGLILGALLTVLIGSVPLLGSPLASFLGPLLLAFGILSGYWQDIKKDSPQLAASITEAGSLFRPLNPKEFT